ncbi:FecR family protein [Dyadobacter arcticus]|uniref:Ferric-dicitrate binding protein FerR (Iron transport regulator) n=1 Tax=Dyadobacter arcticus TaxID=1078754 RepID=A0ABX0UN31_9BACT|nr:FecR family protein [Dyadobacter arcticus]NIJ54398.1 ferric-dicitrate binding protein FerR (iron transport regulator) [Dyadobacter arcticus]
MEENDYKSFDGKSFDCKAFLQKYLQNRHSPEEHELFLKWFHTISPEEADLVIEQYGGMADLRSILEMQNQNDALIKNIESRLDQADIREIPQETPIFTLWPYFRRFSAAAVFILIGLGSYYLFIKQSSPTVTAPQPVIATEGAPGGNRAMLTLADGSKINLNEAVDGQIALQSNIQIYKVTDGQLVYSKPEMDKPTKNNPENYNQITTPKAGQYQINLSDGTKVWLNSLSSIRFPATFDANERKVEITGEVYFEVARYRLNSRKVPFMVVCNNQVIEVVGTHFNVNSYRDEAAVKTTLLEGSVKVYAVRNNSKKLGTPVRLHPGEQSIVNQTNSNGSSIAVEKVDTESAIAWQKGFFKFRDTDIREVMRQLSRWYDLDVVYKGPLPQDQFTGYVSKKVAISNVLNILEEGGGVKFNVKENQVEVMAAE